MPRPRYWRIPSEGLAEIVVAHPTGIAEILEGFAAPNSAGDTDTLIIDVRSTTIAATASAKEVTRTERTFEVTGDVLRYTMRMAAVGQPLTHHLSATLHRTSTMCPGTEQVVGATAGNARCTCRPGRRLPRRTRSRSTRRPPRARSPTIVAESFSEDQHLL